MLDNTIVVISDDEGYEHDEGMNESTPLREAKKDDGMEADDDRPGWLPDGWIMEIFDAGDGIKNRYYISPISDYTFTSQAEVLEFLFSGVDERILESKECAAEIKLHRENLWLPMGWVMEIRVGGKNMDIMYMFYVEPRMKVWLLSKEDVLLYLKETQVTMIDTNGQCDTSSDNNILAQVDIYPAGLPMGWVRELVFRKTKEGSIRRDPYYTDPTSGYTFRTLKSALVYLETGKVPKRAFIQKMSVHDIYSFDKCADLHEFLRSRLTVNLKRCHRRKSTLESRKMLQTGYAMDTQSSEDEDTSWDSNSSTDPEDKIISSMKRTDEEGTSSKTTMNKHSRRKAQKLSQIMKRGDYP